MRDNELLEQIDVEEMLNELGVRNVRDTYSGEIKYSCPFSGHSHLDENPSASMSTQERPVPGKPGEFYPPTTFYCFSCGARGTAITFVAEYEGVSPITAKRFLIDRFVGPQSIPTDTSVLDYVTGLFEKKKVEEFNPVYLPVSEIDKRYINWPEVYCEWEATQNSPWPLCYMLERGFEPETLLDFEVGYDDISSRFSIPVRNKDGSLLGFKARAWWDEAQPKYKVLGGEQYGFEPFEVSLVLFAFHKAKEHKNIIVREGELNAMMMHQMGWTNTVGISGKRVSHAQVTLLKSHADSVTMYFDDIADSLEAAKHFEGIMPVKIAASGENDPADSTKQEVQDVIDSAQSSLLCRLTQMV